MQSHKRKKKKIETINVQAKAKVFSHSLHLIFSFCVFFCISLVYLILPLVVFVHALCYSRLLFFFFLFSDDLCKLIFMSCVYVCFHRIMLCYIICHAHAGTFKYFIYLSLINWESRLQCFLLFFIFILLLLFFYSFYMKIFWFNLADYQALLTLLKCLMGSSIRVCCLWLWHRIMAVKTSICWVFICRNPDTCSQISSEFENPIQSFIFARIASYFSM